MYKLIAVDLDGTLLNSYVEVTEYSKIIIKKLIENGIKFIIASGRPIDSIKTIAKEIGSNDYFIAGNGAIIYDIKKDEIIYEKYLSKSKVLEIIDTCEKNSITYNIYAEKTILATGLKYNILYYYKENMKKEDDKKINIQIVDDMHEYIKNLKEDKFLKMTICDKDKSIFNSSIRKIKQIKDIEVLNISHMSRKIINKGTEEIPIEYYYTEISSSNVDKWNAIQHLAEKLNIQKNEIIAIGDNMNDKKMIENAGLGIVMKGSTPGVTEVADEIAPSNNEDGATKILQKYYNDIKF